MSIEFLHSVMTLIMNRPVELEVMFDQAECPAEVRPFAETEMRKLAETAVLIQLGQSDGSIDKETAEILVAMQANASRAVLTAIETVGMIAAQDAINAAIDVLKAAVNKAVGIAFL